jgi:hypothetical protein
MASVSFGQELSNFYTPYGFRLPYLESGEYSIFLGTSYNKSIQRIEYPTTDIRPENEYKNLNLSLDGLISITNKFLVKASISYYPSLTRSNNEYFYFDPMGPDILFGTKDELNGYIQHGLLFVIRPKSKIELFVDYSMYSSDIDRILDTESSNPSRNNIENEYYSILAGINIIGKL